MSVQGIISSIRRFYLGLSTKRWVQHGLFWIASYLFLLNFFSGPAGVQKIDLIYTALFHISLLTCVYLNIWLLVPGLLRRGWYILYGLTAAALLFATALLNLVTFNFLTDLILPGYYFISYYELDEILKFQFVYLALSSLLKLSKGWFMLMQTEQQLSEIHREKVETELKALKSQINPHFLFNSLNNIYSLALGGSGKTPAAVLKLSDLMRYMLYESNTEKVPLKRELNFISNFIELQKLRSDKQSRIEFRKTGNPSGKSIAPLLFLPLVENAFKHGIKGDPSGGYAIVEFAVKDSIVDLYVENNKGKVERVEQDQFNGIGLINVKRRLDLIYPDRYELDIRETEENFSVRLKLDLK